MNKIIRKMNKTIKIFAILFFTVGICKNIKAQDTLKFSLKEAQEFAIQNNVEVTNASLDIISANKKIWETTAIGLPQITGQYSHQYLPGDLPTISFGDPDAPPIKLGVKNSGTYNITLSQLVFSGEYLVGLQASKTFKELSENNYEKKKIDAKDSISSNYYTILVLKKSIEILDSSISNLESTIYN